jgi:hypothetical protein
MAYLVMTALIVMFIITKLKWFLAIGLIIIYLLTQTGVT